MYRAFSVLGIAITLLGWVPVAHAQTNEANVPTNPEADASSLQGIEERSIQSTFPQATESEVNTGDQTNPDGSVSAQSLFGFDERIQVRIRPERTGSQTDVFPGNETSRGNQFQLLYQLNQ